MRPPGVVGPAPRLDSQAPGVCSPSASSLALGSSTGSDLVKSKSG
jgi:hypothetical protein